MGTDTPRGAARRWRPRARVISLLVAGCVALVVAAATASAALAGAIVTVAGSESAGSSGDGGPATAAALTYPVAVAPTADGGFLIADDDQSRIRRVSAAGTITTVAGNGRTGFSGDGGPATAAALDGPTDVRPTPDGGFLISDGNNNRVRRVFPDGTIRTVAGNGSQSPPSGDGGPATAATVSPDRVAVTADGGYLIVDDVNNQVRRVSASGTITTVAGNGRGGFGGDGGPATAATLLAPGGAAPTPDGGFLFADTFNNRIRRVSATGTITTIAGNGKRGFSGDGGPASRARLYEPQTVTLTTDGGLLISDDLNHRIRKVTADGRIHTVAGDGTPTFFGDGGPPSRASLFDPFDAVPTPDGGFLIADSGNGRIRKVNPGPDPPPLTCGANRGQPRVGRTVVVRHVSGAVSVMRAGSRRVQRLHGSATIPLGSTVDTTHGRVRLVSATCRVGSTLTSTLYGGAFTVAQSRRSAQTNVVLTGGGLGGCNGRASIARRRVRRLYGRAPKGVTITGRNTSAGTVRGTLWLTQDTCGATTTSAIEGRIIVTAKGGFPETVTLDPGDRLSLFCTAHGPAAVPFYCLSMTKFGSERNTFRIGFDADVSPSSSVFSACATGPGLSRCFSNRFGLDPGTYSLEIACSPRRAGVFTGRWRVGGRLLGTLDSPRMPGGGNNACSDVT